MLRRMRIAFLWLLLALCLAIGGRLLPGLWQACQRLLDLPPIYHHSGPSLQALVPLSNLVSLRVEVSDVLETRMEGWTGGIVAAVLVKGDVELSTDLGQARFEEVDEEARTAVLVLPEPVASQARLDHDRTRICLISREGLWHLVPGDRAETLVVNHAYEEAQQSVASAAQGEALRQKARAQTEQVLETFFESMNWRVRVRWGDHP